MTGETKTQEQAKITDQGEHPREPEDDEMDDQEELKDKDEATMALEGLGAVVKLA